MSKQGVALIKEGPEAVCEMCGRQNICWHTDSALWNRFVRSREMPEILCPVCFAAFTDVSSWRMVPDPSMYSAGGVVTGDLSVGLGHAARLAAIREFREWAKENAMIGESGKEVFWLEDLLTKLNEMSKEEG